MNCTRSSCWRTIEIGSTVDTEHHGFIIDHEGARAVSQGGLDNERMAPVGTVAGEQKGRPEPASFWSFLLCLFLNGVSGVPRCILHIARSVVDGSLGLINLAFGFHVLVTTELTGTFFDGAFGLVRSALYMFAIHDRVPLLTGMRDNERGARWFLRHMAWLLRSH
jgi:hypothetical protein